jgi:hypothetical protein
MDLDRCLPIRFGMRRPLCPLKHCIEHVCFVLLADIAPDADLVVHIARYFHMLFDTAHSSHS